MKHFSILLIATIILLHSSSVQATAITNPSKSLSVNQVELEHDSNSEPIFNTESGVKPSIEEIGTDSSDLLNTDIMTDQTSDDLTTIIQYPNTETTVDDQLDIENEDNKDTDNIFIPEIPEINCSIINSEGSLLRLSFPFSSKYGEMTNIYCQYSFDGVTYLKGEDIRLNPSFFKEGEIFATMIGFPHIDPLKSYLNGKESSIYIKLQYTVNDIVYESNCASIIKDKPIPLPDDIAVVAFLPNSLLDFSRQISYQYYLSTLPNSSISFIQALLPDSLPIQISFYKGVDSIGEAKFDYFVNWNFTDVDTTDGSITALPDFTPPSINNEIILLEGIPYLLDTIPTTISSPYFPYQIPVPFNILLSNTSTKEFHLHEDDDLNSLKISFPLKPSGATKIIPSYSLDNGKTWIVVEDLLTSHNNKSIEISPGRPDYSHITLFTKEQSPYKEYLAGEINGFDVQLDIEGGTFHGNIPMKQFPIDYEFLPPPDDNTVDNGSGGNHGNTGNNNNSSDEGVRPNKPDISPAQNEISNQTTDSGQLLIDDFALETFIASTGTVSIKPQTKIEDTTKYAPQSNIIEDVPMTTNKNIIENNNPNTFDETHIKTKAKSDFPTRELSVSSLSLAVVCFMLFLISTSLVFKLSLVPKTLNAIKHLFYRP